MGDVTTEKAKFIPQTGSMKDEEIIVHFNPDSLKYSISNTLENKGKSGKTKQYVGQSTGKLSMELVFDTTHNGEDVRVYTDKLAKFMEAENKVPPTILFEWGTYKFQGMVESFTETTEFFSPTGIPLRSQVSISMVDQDEILSRGDTDQSFDTSAELDPLVMSGASDSASSLADKAGNPEAARALASANGLESLRMSAGVDIAISAGIELKGPVAFASGGAGGGLGISGGLDLGVSGGISGGISGGLSAGVSASAGAFAGLSSSASAGGSISLDTGSLIQAPASAGISTDSGASFDLSGKSTISGSASLTADVGASADLQASIEFDGD